MAKFFRIKGLLIVAASECIFSKNVTAARRQSIALTISSIGCGQKAYWLP